MGWKVRKPHLHCNHALRSACLGVCAWPRVQGKEKEKEKAHDRLNKWSVSLLNEALDVFDLPRGSGEEGKKVRAAMIGVLVRFAHFSCHVAQGRRGRGEVLHKMLWRSCCTLRC